MLFARAKVPTLTSERGAHDTVASVTVAFILAGCADQMSVASA